ncbi:unnamed protein product [Clavelina lepadiformis]|uniref:Uncharacterized protein n=1 Tax=Clavelina lepadiformis TaxID=159417 RepID=A0ABP0GCC9_CLALP
MTREPENESVRITVESLILTVTEQVSDESRPLDTKENVNTQTIDDEIVSKTRRVGLPPEKEYKSARRLFSRSDSEVKANIRDIIKFKEACLNKDDGYQIPTLNKRTIRARVSQSGPMAPPFSGGHERVTSRGFTIEL